jgi:hypothetical protein
MKPYAIPESAIPGRTKLLVSGKSSIYDGPISRFATASNRKANKIKSLLGNFPMIILTTDELIA